MSLLTHEAKLGLHVDAIHGLVIDIDTLNVPLVSAGGVGRSKPGSRVLPPQAAKRAVAQALEALKDCEDRLERIWNSASIVEHHGTQPDSIGGIETNAVELAENPVSVARYEHEPEGITMPESELQAALAHRNAMTRQRT